MKRPIIFILSAVLLAGGCQKKQIELYSGENTIYFTLAADEPAFNSGKVKQDSLSVTFAYTTNDDSVIKIPVRVTGAPATTSRAYQVKLLPGSTAKQGIHFDFIDKELTIPAGSNEDSIRIRLYRTADLKSNEVLLLLGLEANQFFTTRMGDQAGTGGTSPLSLNTFRIYCSDILKQPETWVDYYMGTFSAKKFYLIGQVLDIDLSRFSGPAFANISFQELLYYGIAMQRYLNRMRSEGHPILEDDGTEMVMGIGVQ